MLRRFGKMVIPKQVDPEAALIDPSQPLPAPPDDDDLSWGDGKEFAPTREDAIAEFGRVLNELADEEPLRAGDDAGVTFHVAVLVDRYKFRARPWLSDSLTALIDGDLIFPGLTLSRTEKVGEYRLQRSVVAPWRR